MSVIVRAYSEVDGQIAEASSVNRVIDDLYTLQGGNLNNSNIAPSGINSSNYARSSVYSDVLQDQSVIPDKVDYQTVLMMEVFS